jgi:NADPH-dependent 2,4-dienoyl-CoA reductase/sulfur reductase-like enzyme
MQSKVSKILPSTSDSSLAGSVIVQGPSGDETTLEADFVVMGVGVGPATKFLKDSPGWELERDGGVRVDEYLRVVGKEHVYAVGDIAHFPQAETGEVRRIEHWNVSCASWVGLRSSCPRE